MIQGYAGARPVSLRRLEMSDAAAPIRILVVDDHPALRLGLGAMLETQGDMVIVGDAANGREAIESFTNLRPDVVLMDLQMPSMNGLEAIQEIRSNFKNARIIVLTTFDREEQAIRALKAGAAAYMLKTAARTVQLKVGRVAIGARCDVIDDVRDLAAKSGVEKAPVTRSVPGAHYTQFLRRRTDNGACL